MRHLDIDWARMIELMPAWDGLDPDVRGAALDHLKPSGQHPIQPLAAHADTLVRAGLAEVSATGARIGVCEAWRETIRALRALQRTSSSGEAPPSAVGYMREHFSSEALRALDPAPPSYHGWYSWHDSADTFTSEAWILGFLEISDAGQGVAWERRHQLGDESLHFGRPEVFPTTQRLVRTLVDHPEGVLLRDLPALLHGVPPALLGRALHAALRYLLVFAYLDESLRVWVGLWPEAVRRIRRPAAEPPAEVQPVEEFNAAVLLEDMTSLLIAVSSEQIRLRASDGAIFARAMRALTERLLTLPEWLGFRDDDPDERIETARGVLQAFGMLRLAGGKEPRIESTSDGPGWLSMPPARRLRTLLDSLRTPSGERLDEWGFPVWRFSPLDHGIAEDLEIRMHLTRVFRTLPNDHFVDLEGWLGYHTRVGNPLLASKQLARRLGRGDVRNAAMAEDLWEAVLGTFLVERMIALGGVTLGRSLDERLGIRLADPGAYLLGLIDDFEYGTEPTGAVVVQPNFDIVFLGPAPLIEAQLARVAERIGAGPGVVFRLTRPALLTAAAAGIGQEEFLQLLTDSSNQPLPANVVRQVGDWFGEVRRVTMRSALLIHCPDEETAARVRGVMGKKAQPISATVIEVQARSGKERNALVRELRGKGFLVDL